MQFPAKLAVLVAATIVSSAPLWFAGALHAASGEEVIKARVAFMEDEMEGHWKPLAAFAKSGSGSLAEVEKNARAIAKLAKEIPKHFPKDTGRGKYPDKMTRALPAIWEDPEGFKRDIQRLVDGSEQLARLASEGKKDEVVEMIGPSGSYAKTKIGCAECHDHFRGRRVK
ncbi:MAG: Cytochrome c [Burkholderiales bacterium]|jgi:cytochrome c556|nr:Cytochrome c [Burkholderiales bacterium]